MPPLLIALILCLGSFLEVAAADAPAPQPAPLPPEIATEHAAAVVAGDAFTKKAAAMIGALQQEVSSQHAELAALRAERDAARKALAEAKAAITAVGMGGGRRCPVMRPIRWVCRSDGCRSDGVWPCFVGFILITPVIPPPFLDGPPPSH